MRKILLLLIVVSLILLSGCMPKEQQLEEKISEEKISPQEEAEKIAERFARYWEQGDYESMYDLFVSELQNQRSKKDFVNFFFASEKLENVVVRLDEVILDNENEAYVYYTVSSSVYDAKAPAMKMERVDDEWKVNAFVNFFTDDCAETCELKDYGTLICSSETLFECKYISECQTNVACMARITQEEKEECASKGYSYVMHSYCTREDKCKTHCSNSGVNVGSKMLSMDAMAFQDYIEFKNFDKELTHVSLVINEIFRKDLEKIDSNSRFEIQKEEFLNEVGKDLPRRFEIKTIYVYSREGKWLWYTGKYSNL